MAKHRSQFPYLVGFGGLFLMLAGLLFQYWGNDVWQQHKANQKIAKLQSLVHEREQALDQRFDTLKKMRFRGIVNQFDGVSTEAHESGYFLYIFRNRNLMLWSHNHILPEPEIPTDTSLSLKKLNNGYYLQKSLAIEDLTFSGLIPIKTNYAVENQYLQNRLLHVKNGESYFSFHVKNDEGIAIEDSNGKALFYLKIKDQLPKSNLPFWLLAIGGGLLLASLSQLLIIGFSSNKWGLVTASILGWLIFFLAWFHWKQPAFIFDHPIFSAKHYAANNFLDSLGDLMIFTSLLTALIYNLTKHFELPKVKSGFARYSWFFLTFLITIAGVQSFAWLINSLIVHSSIYLDIQDFYQITAFSLVSLLIIFLVFYNLLRFANWAFHQIQNISRFRYAQVVIMLIAGLIYGAAVYWGWIPYYGAFTFALLLWLGFFWFEKAVLPNFKPLIFFTLTGALFIASHLIYANEYQEHQKRKLLASQIATQRDVLSEYLFNNVSQKIKQDKFVRDFFQNPMISRSLLDQRIRQLYFNQFLNQYDLKIYTYKYGSVPYKSKNPVPLDYFRNLIEQNGEQTIGDHFFFVNDGVTRPTYLAFYDFKSLGSSFGSLIIELKKKVFYEESIYPELLLKQEALEKNELENYSYAIYQNNRLISQKGDYPYPVISKPEEGKSYLFFTENGYSHLYHQENKESFVLLSKKLNSPLYPVSVFSFLFLVLFLCGLVMKSIWETKLYKPRFWKVWIEAIRKGKIRPFKDLLFQRKIQFVISFSVLLVFIVVGLTTVGYFRNNYNEKLNESLENKTRLVLSQIEQMIQANETSMFFNKREKLFSKVKKLSNQHQTDINVYDLDGNLVATSQSGVYDKNIIENLINARAFYQLRVNNSSQLIQNERIGNLNYLASYTPIRNSNNQILGFLHLPYFAKETKLKNEISSLIITMVNLYVLVFIIIIVISLLISNALMKPLNLIREKLQTTQLGRPNEPINWHSNDEIGNLIREYNHKLEELKENAETLAESEREGAWREMARQVAHEIKNPLTPMKLNIQKLQRSFLENAKSDPNEVKRVSNILIQQIDHLSQIATEFSDFSKIPPANQDIVRLEEKILASVNLFDDQNGPELTTDLQTRETQIVIDQDHLSRVLNNLINNAIQAIPAEKKGRVEIGTKYPKGHPDKIQLWVKDNGTGIPEKKAKQIFKPNFSTKNSGMGLGLAIVRKIIEESNGKIWFVSRENEGTTFFIEWSISHEEL